MTEKKKLPEQRPAYDYWAVTEKDPPTLGNRSNDPRITKRAQQQQDRVEQRWQEVRRRERESIGTSVSLRRIVTVPQSDPSYAGNAFVERQRQRRERAQSRRESSGQTQYVARTLAQTGSRASTGRVSVMPRQLPSQQSPVPARSGQQKPKRSRFWRFLSIFTIMAMIIVLGAFLLTGSAFRIAQVRVVGTHNDALIQRVQKMGMLGQNIFLLDVASLTKEIDAQPEVDTVNLGKQLPSQLVVSIKERVPVLLWQTSSGIFSIDEQGMVIAPADHIIGADHLSTVIDISSQEGQTNTGKSETVLRPGAWINKTDVAFALAIIKQLPLVTGESANSYKLYSSGTIYSSVNRTSEEGRDGSGIYTLENSVASWRAYLGDAGDPNPLSNRLLELRSILAMVQQHQLNVATIDLRYGLNPVITLQ